MSQIHEYILNNNVSFLSFSGKRWLYDTVWISCFFLDRTKDTKCITIFYNKSRSLFDVCYWWSFRIVNSRFICEKCLKVDQSSPQQGVTHLKMALTTFRPD